LTIANKGRIVARRRHPKKEVEQALRVAETRGWKVQPQPRGHRWGVMRCPAHEHWHPIWSTPKNPGNHAKELGREMQRCEHVR
jgi:hypothetical protein